MTACASGNASRAVFTTRSLGLETTTGLRSRRGPRRIRWSETTWRRLFAVSGSSVAPGYCPVTVHSVSPWRTMTSSPCAPRDPGALSRASLDRGEIRAPASSAVDSTGVEE